jgi:hypothetical protein
LPPTNRFFIPHIAGVVISNEVRSLPVRNPAGRAQAARNALDRQLHREGGERASGTAGRRLARAKNYVQSERNCVAGIYRPPAGCTCPGSARQHLPAPHPVHLYIRIIGIVIRVIGIVIRIIGIVIRIIGIVIRVIGIVIRVIGIVIRIIGIVIRVIGIVIRIIGIVIRVIGIVIRIIGIVIRVIGIVIRIIGIVIRVIGIVIRVIGIRIRIKKLYIVASGTHVHNGSTYIIADNERRIYPSSLCGIMPVGDQPA